MMKKPKRRASEVEGLTNAVNEKRRQEDKCFEPGTSFRNG